MYIYINYFKYQCADEQYLNIDTCFYKSKKKKRKKIEIEITFNYNLKLMTSLIVSNKPLLLCISQLLLFFFSVRELLQTVGRENLPLNRFFGSIWNQSSIIWNQSYLERTIRHYDATLLLYVNVKHVLIYLMRLTKWLNRLIFGYLWFNLCSSQQLAYWEIRDWWMALHFFSFK